MTSDLTGPLQTLLRLVEYLGLLLALSYVYSLARPAFKQLSPRLQPGILGLIFGFFAAITMLLPIASENGFSFDGRHPMIIMATLYGGLISGVISTLMVIPIRIAIGGMGAISAPGSLLIAMLLTLYFKRRYGDANGLPARRLAELGIIVTIQALLWLLIIPTEESIQAVQRMALPLLFFGPTSIVLIGTLLRHQERQATLEQELRDSEARFQQIAEASEQVFWIYEPGTPRPLYISPAFEKVWGRKVQDVYERQAVLIETFHPDDQSVVWGLLANPKAKTVFTEFRILRPNGDVRWIAGWLYPLLNNDGSIRRVVGLAEDITEHKQALSNKIELEVERERGAMLRRFISDASHDLRTPITIIHTSLYLLGRSLENDRQKQYAGQVQTQINRITRLIEDMLAISELDASDLSVELQPVKLNQLAEEALRRRLPEAKAKERLLTSDFTSETVWVMVEESRFSEAIDRVMKNAIAYTAAGDSVKLATYRRDENAIIEISDTGIGIPEDDLPHIFQRFYRVDKARGADAGGAGLGLSIARKIVDLHHGDIEVESKPNDGSIFRFVLPITAPPQESEAAAPQRTSQPL